eukprot:TRINITY_DN60786_c0_g1_i1.p1 TRINITY_DN60786_c0_g1~~TRINITY_DN60786_c0_g1_i1.p1  ORF type:complete len:761 (+),score=209.43 TRINITY_DN60786_c0_g1_i1:54-2336(+)
MCHTHPPPSCAPARALMAVRRETGPAMTVPQRGPAPPRVLGGTGLAQRHSFSTAADYTSVGLHSRSATYSGSAARIGRQQRQAQHQQGQLPPGLQKDLAPAEWITPQPEEMNKQGVFWGKDAKGSWWPVVVLRAVPTDGSDNGCYYEVAVHDNTDHGAHWPRAHRGNLRRLPRRSSPSPSPAPAPQPPGGLPAASPRVSTPEGIHGLSLQEQIELAQKESLRSAEKEQRDRLSREGNKLRQLQDRYPYAPEGELRRALALCSDDVAQAAQYLQQAACVEYTDPDGDRIVFRRRDNGDGACYSVNGEDREAIRQVNLGAPVEGKYPFGALRCELASGPTRIVPLPADARGVACNVRVLLDLCGVAHGLGDELVEDGDDPIDSPRVLDSLGLRGLANLGNSCYLNAAVQCLASTSELVQHFTTELRGQPIVSRWALRGQLAAEFRRVLYALCCTEDGQRVPSARPISIARMKTLLADWSPQFQGAKLHDAHELLRCLLDGLHGDLQRVQEPPPYEELRDVDGESDHAAAKRWWEYYCSRESSIIHDLFAGQLQSCVVCEHCSQRHPAFDPFLDLSVPLADGRGAAAGASCPSLDDCIRLFARPETLDNAEMPTCRRCKARRRARRHVRLCRAPQFLVVHLKRFRRERDEFDCLCWKKLCAEVRVPPTLDLTWFTTDKPIGGAPRYELYGVVHHHGGLDGGHYTATARRRDGRWYLFNDSVVTRAAEPSAPSATAYLAFYRQAGARQLDGSAGAATGSSRSLR